MLYCILLNWFVSSCLYHIVCISGIIVSYKNWVTQAPDGSWIHDLTLHLAFIRETSGWVDLFNCSIVDQDDCVGIHEPSFKRWQRRHGWHYGTGILFFLVIFILYIYLSIFNSEFWLIITAPLWTLLLFYKYHWLEPFVSCLFLSSCCNIAERGSIFLSILYQAFTNYYYCQEHGMVLLCYRKHIFLNILFIHSQWKVDTQVGLVKCHILGIRSKVIKHWFFLHCAYAI